MKRLIGLMTVLLMLPLQGLADLALLLSSDTVAVESVLDFTLEGDTAPLYSYTLQKGNKTLFQSAQAPWSFGSYLPLEEGDYILTATAHYADNPVTASAAFTVTPPMTCTFSPLPAVLRAGDPLVLAVSARGGSGSYRYLYTLSQDGVPLLSLEKGASFTWVPQEAGDYILDVLVADSLGANVQQNCAIRVTDGPGISIHPSGGALMQNGGQKSYTVYSPGPWQAETACPFLRLDRASGQSGDTLILSIQESTDTYREGILTVESMGKRVDLSIAQLIGWQVEEEISLLPRPQTLHIDGAVHALWTSARDSRSFSVSSAGAWQAEGNDFIRLEQSADSLTLSLAPHTGTGVRQGLVTLKNQNSTAFIHVYQLPEEAESTPFIAPETPFPLPQEAADFTLHSQCSGYWADKAYRHSNLEQSGCAIFALSHALQHLGYTGDAIRPENLAVTYAFALMKDDSGTMNSTLVGNAGDDFGFKTRYELYTDVSQIRSKMDQGAVFSFSVVSGHIAMIIEKSADGRMFRVVDSAPSATWERIKGASLYRQEEDGRFVPLTSLAELEGIRYYPQNDSFGGATYWLEADYIARRGARLIQPK
ncbi:MAG: hypothetical protein E7324_06055 [Clostridiales bacterium]|nr:hypothetical protein [Clostridiales bacterium]